MKIRELLSSADKWCQGPIARDAQGHHVEFDDTAAVQWCLYGALRLCYRGQLFSPVYKTVVGALPGYQPMVTEWNDRPGRTFEEVKALVDRLDV